MVNATHRIKRTFPGPFVMYPGQLVDATNWPNLPLLESQGYIERLEEQRPAAVEPSALASGPASPPEAITAAVTIDVPVVTSPEVTTAEVPTRTRRRRGQ